MKWNYYRKFTTSNLYKAAMFILHGAEILEIEGTYPRNTVVMNVPKYAFLREQWRWVNYKKFQKVRNNLKNRCKKEGTGGFLLGDIAKVQLRK